MPGKTRLRYSLLCVERDVKLYSFAVLAPLKSFDIGYLRYANAIVIITARRTIEQSAVLRLHVVCLSVRLSVTLVDQEHIG